jgi:hypothetical protein
LTPTVGQLAGGRLLRVAAALGVIGAAALALDHGRGWFSYLTAYLFVLTIALGALVLLLIFYVTNAVWPTVLRRLLESIAATLPLCALLFLPLGFGRRALYPWASPERPHPHAVAQAIAHQAVYFSPAFFWGRAAFAFLCWCALALALRGISLRQDRDSRPLGPARALSAAGLPVIALTLSFAAFDWVMSLEPDWASTMFGFYVGVGALHAATAALTLATYAAARARLLPKVNLSHCYALGRLLLLFTALWGYIAFFQFFLIWIANKPEEVTWMAVRTLHGWRPVAIALAVGRFAVPFFALLSYAVKHRPRLLCALAIWILGFHYLDAYWLVLPAARPASALPHPGDVGALLLVGAAALGFGVLALRGRPVAPQGDPDLANALAYESV